MHGDWHRDLSRQKNTHSGRARCRVFCPRIVCQPLWISGLPIFRWNGFCRFDFLGFLFPYFLVCSMPSYGHDISLLRDVRDGCMKHNPHVTFYLARPNPYLAPSDLPWCLVFSSIFWCPSSIERPWPNIIGWILIYVMFLTMSKAEIHMLSKGCHEKKQCRCGAWT